MIAESVEIVEIDWLIVRARTKSGLIPRRSFVPRGGRWVMSSIQGLCLTCLGLSPPKELRTINTRM